MTEPNEESQKVGGPTPGPWEVYNGGIWGGPYQRCLAWVGWGQGAISLDLPKEEKEANAALMTKAWLIPEVVETLRKAEAALRWFQVQSWNWSDTDAEALTQIRETLSKIVK